MMSRKYACDQPSGFVNHLQKLAVVGAGGHIGSQIVPHLVAGGKIHVTAITRLESQSDFITGVSIERTPYDDHQGLIKALQGQEALLICLSVRAAPGTAEKMIDAAAAGGVRYIIPTEFSCAENDPVLGSRYQGIRDYVASKGLTWIGTVTGFWYDWSLSLGLDTYGIDIQHRRVALMDNGAGRLLTSPLSYAGLAVARLLELPLLPRDAEDSSPTLSRYFNSTMHVGAFDVSQREMFQAVMTVTSTTETDWTIEHTTSKARFEEGQRRFQTGEVAGRAQLLYSRMFYPEDHPAWYVDIEGGVDDERLGLTKPDLLAETRKIVDAVSQNGLGFQGFKLSA